LSDFKVIDSRIEHLGKTVAALVEPVNFGVRLDLIALSKEREAVEMGRYAARLCDEFGIVPRKVPAPPPYGAVNSYPCRILDATWRRRHPTPQKLGAHNEW
jgi:hypothetical protein